MDRAFAWAPSQPPADRGTTDWPRVAERRAVRGWTTALVLLCAVALWVRFATISSTLPYPWDTDEGYVSGPANRMLLTGTLHPYIFNYPSLPKYLAAIGMGVGFIRSAGHLEVREIRQLGNVGYPYYDTPRAMQTARQLFALLSVVALAATGIAAWHAFEIPAMIFFAPLVLSTSELFFYHSWTYLNVDIVGLCFVALTFAACLKGTRAPSLQGSALLPGAFAGLAIGGKYTLAMVAVPMLLGVALYVKPGRRIWAGLAALAAMVLAFLIVTPFSLIDIPGFLNGVASEAFHYARGHTGAEAPPGLPQAVFYAQHFRSEFGIAGLAVAAVGAGAYVAADWRRGLILGSFPVAVFWMLLPQRTHFTRNVLGLHPIVSMFLAYGIIRAHRSILAFAARRTWIGSPPRLRVRVLVGLILIATIPLWRFRDQFRDHTDSRKVALAFLEKRIPRDWTIVVPSELGIDMRALQAKGAHVSQVNLQPATDTAALLRTLASVQPPAVILLPHWGADSRFPGQEAADALNRASQLWQVMRTFGTNPVLTNYASPTPWGDPAFDIAVIGRPR